MDATGLKPAPNWGSKPTLPTAGDRSPDALAAYVRITNERRDLTGEQRAAAMLVQDQWLAEQKDAAKKRQSAGGGDKKSAAYKESAPQKIGEPIKDKHAGETTQKIATQAGTNRQYVADLQKFKETEPELFEQVRTGKIKLVHAKRIVKEKKREAKRQANRDKIEAVSDPLQAVGEVQYSAIVIDPPWDWNDEGDVNQMGRSMKLLNCRWVQWPPTIAICICGLPIGRCRKALR